MLNILYLTNKGHLKFLGQPCRTRLECELQLVQVFRRRPFLDQAKFFIASDAPRKTLTLHRHYVSNVGWLAARLKVEEQEHREKAWRDRRHLPLSLTRTHREKLAVALAKSLADSLVENPAGLTPELLREELNANLPEYMRFAGVSFSRNPQLLRQFQEIVKRACKKLQESR
jgi:hypothetical protein